MVRIPHIIAMVVVAAGIGSADIVRLAQQPEIQLAQQWVPAPRLDPDIQGHRQVGPGLAGRPRSGKGPE
jgi:hypothetical protein